MEKQSYLDSLINGLKSSYTPGEDLYKALELACENGRTDILKMLIEMGSTIKNIRDDFGIAVDLACRDCRTDILKILFEMGSTIEDVREHSSYFNAIFRGHIETVEFLVEKGLNVEDLRTQCQAMLAVVSRRGDIEMFKLLLKIGINREDFRENCNPIIGEICGIGLIDLLRFLINESFIDIEDVRLCSCFYGPPHPETVKFLIESGVDLDQFAEVLKK